MSHSYYIINIILEGDLHQPQTSSFCFHPHFSVFMSNPNLCFSLQCFLFQTTNSLFHREIILIQFFSVLQSNEKGEVLNPLITGVFLEVCHITAANICSLMNCPKCFCFSNTYNTPGVLALSTLQRSSSFGILRSSVCQLKVRSCKTRSVLVFPFKFDLVSHRGQFSNLLHLVCISLVVLSVKFLMTYFRCLIFPASRVLEKPQYNHFL